MHRCFILLFCSTVTLVDELPWLDELPANAPLIEYYDEQPLPQPGSKLAVLVERIDRDLRRATESAQRLLATLRVRINYRLYATGADATDITAWQRAYTEISIGRNPFERDPGGLRGYYATNDDSCQVFKVFPPADNPPPPKSGLPLVVSMHGHGWHDWYRPFQLEGGSTAGAYVVSVHGRGSADYKWIAEDDVLAAVDAVQADFPIDPSRVYLTGGSMGATGVFQVGAHYPHRFAAGFADSGNADISAWSGFETENPAGAYEALRARLRSLTSPIAFAENFLNLPLIITHSRTDSTAAHSQRLAKRLGATGCRDYTFTLRDGDHVDLQPMAERFDALGRFRTNRWPYRVRFKAVSYRQATAYWVTIGQFERRLEPAELDVRRFTNTQIKIDRIVNVAGFRLQLDGLDLDRTQPLSIVMADGQAVTVPAAAPGPVTLTKNGAAWQLDNSHGAGLFKRKGLEGPIADVFREPFLLVVGTSAVDSFERWVVAQEAARFQRQWRRRFQVNPPLRLDSALTVSDIYDRNLILFGGPTQNTVTQALNLKLPVRIDGDSVVAGDKTYRGAGLGVHVVYPNPLSADRAVVVFGAVDWRGMWQITHRFGNWFDWMPLDNYCWYDFCVFDDRSRGLETFLECGVFDERWQFAETQRFGGVAADREAVIPRLYPTHRVPPPDTRTVRLTELWPIQVDTAKDPMRIDRSWNDKPLTVSGEKMSFGFGQWIESAVSYNLNGQFSRFRARVGIDPEGAETIDEARSYAENPTFIVAGDDKILAQQSEVRFGEAPRRFDVDVSGVKRLTLMVVRNWPAGWLYGAIAWGEPTVERRPKADQ